MFILTLLNQIKNQIVAIWSNKIVHRLVPLCLIVFVGAVIASSMLSSAINNNMITASSEVTYVVTQLNSVKSALSGKGGNGDKNKDSGTTTTTTEDSKDGGTTNELVEESKDSGDAKDSGEAVATNLSAEITEKSDSGEKIDDTAVAPVASTDDKSSSGTDDHGDSNASSTDEKSDSSSSSTDEKSDSSSSTNTSSTSSSSNLKSSKATYSPATAVVESLQVICAAAIPTAVIYLLYKRFTSDKVAALPVLYTGDAGGTDEEH